MDIHHCRMTLAGAHHDGDVHPGASTGAAGQLRGRAPRDLRSASSLSIPKGHRDSGQNRKMAGASLQKTARKLETFIRNSFGERMEHVALQHDECASPVQSR